MSDAANDLDLSLLPPEFRALFEAQAAQVAELKEINKRLEHLVAELNHAVHGKKSEKLDEDNRQLLFEDLEVAVAEVQERKDTQVTGEDTPKRNPVVRRNLGNLPEHLERIEQIVEPDSLICPCGCGEMHMIGEDRSERLDIVPAKLRVIITVRPKYACRHCTDGVTQASAPARLIERALPTEGSIAHVLVSKYADHCPLHRQSQILGRAGIDIHRSTLADLGRQSGLPSGAGGRPAGRTPEDIHEAIYG